MKMLKYNLKGSVYLPAGISEEYHYARFSTNYIDLATKPSLSAGEKYYRIFYNYNPLLYTEYDTTYSTTDFVDVPVSKNLLDCPHISDFFILMFVCTVSLVCVFNVITSFIHKGGILN